MSEREPQPWFNEQGDSMRLRKRSIRTIAFLAAAACITDTQVSSAESDSEFDEEFSEYFLTPADREAAINAKAASANMGNATTGFAHFSNGASRYYQNGSVWFGDAVGRAHVVLGLILQKWQNKGGVNFIGYPLSDEGDTRLGDGRFNWFQSGTVFYKWGASDAYEMHGCNIAAYGAYGWEWGKLGFPTSDEITGANKPKNDMEYGKIYYKHGYGHCYIDSYPVLTANRGFTNSDGIATISAEIVGSQTDVRINVTGSGFAPNAEVNIRTNNPGGTSHVCTTYASATGTINNASNTLCRQSDSLLKKINNIATVQAFDMHGHTAVYPASVSSQDGTVYTGAT
jgi:hypothetical protein